MDRSVVRGDRYLAVGDADKAIAEYLLARRVSGDTDDLLLRLGHAYAVRGDVDEALTVYETLAERRPAAAASGGGVARRTRVVRTGAGRGGEHVPRAAAPRRLGTGLPSRRPPALAGRPIMRTEGDYARALSLRLALLAGEGDPEPERCCTMSGSHMNSWARAPAHCPSIGDFLEAMEESPLEPGGRPLPLRQLPLRVRRRGPCGGAPGRRPREARPKWSNSAYPRTHMVEAHFLIGELHLALGETDEALVNYARVLELNPTRTHALVRRAEERIRQIRFGFE